MQLKQCHNNQYGPDSFEDRQHLIDVVVFDDPEY